MLIFNHNDTDIVLVYEQGHRGDCLVFYEYENGAITEPYATLSTNVPYYRPLNPFEFAIKNYSENEGLFELLKQHDLGHGTGTVSTGFVIIPIFQFDEVKLNNALFNPFQIDLDLNLER